MMAHAHTTLCHTLRVTPAACPRCATPCEIAPTGRACKNGTRVMMSHSDDWPHEAHSGDEAAAAEQVVRGVRIVRVRLVSEQVARLALGTGITVRYVALRYSTAQYSTVQYSTVQYNTVQYNTIQYITVQFIPLYGIIWHYMALYGHYMALFHSIPFHSIPFHSIPSHDLD